MTDKSGNTIVFGLDIGTRSIVGSVGYMSNNKFNVIAHCVKEHDTRAMIDGQIHDIEKVAETIRFVKKELEKQLDITLSEVCIAAAGRVLKTYNVRADYVRNDDNSITSDEVYNLEMLGVEKAYEIIRKEDPDVEYYCVGYSVIKYYLNDYIMNVLEGHRGKKISADVLATFLPNDVVDGLYNAINLAGLSVVNLTLEPIAAINIAIPEQFRLLNIALVDVGAGTSDISITKDGSIIAYGMIPHAGDEITENIARQCLVDFKTGEKIKIASLKNKSVSYKDIMGMSHKLLQAEARELYKDTVSMMTREIADKIIELNGGKSVSAVFVVGGGGKAYGFTNSLAENLGLANERVALRGEEVLGSVVFEDKTIKKDPLLVTPIGICLNYYAKHNNFIFVNVNDERIKLYDNDKLTVVDAAMQIGFPNEGLFPRRGKELVFKVNGVERMVRGEVGEPAVITINGEEVNLGAKIIKNDNIVIKESTAGSDAKMNIGSLPEFKQSLTLTINANNIVCPKFAMVNKEHVSESHEIQSGDEVEILNYYTVAELMAFMDIAIDTVDITVNNAPALPETKIYERFEVSFAPKKVSNYTAEPNNNEPEDGITETGADETETSEDNATVKPTGAKDVIVIVNKAAVILSGKPAYIFVDILDFYPFDTHKAGGTELVMTVNGQKCDFMTPVHDSDIIELYWK
ncbi:MAG: cell division protein FtsA [Lachnospiraceae bacterium]|nr:cell division protein FtsA [Lachnospiraceae bacterium]